MTNVVTPESPLRIGAVARLTGLSPHTLRKWEDRYAAVQPARTEGGERIYSRNDLQRLMLIRNLSRAGLALRSLARASLDELQKIEREIGEHAAEISPGGLARPVRVGVIGVSVAALLLRQDPPYPTDLEIIATGPTVDQLLERLGELRPDVLVYEVPGVTPATVEAVSAVRKRTSVHSIIVAYSYATRDNLRRLSDQGIELMRMPVDRRELQRGAVRLGREAAGSQPADIIDSEIRAPRLTPAALARAASASPQIKCECPHHIAGLLHGLLAFEDYSAACENANEEDAELHHYLWLITARARMTFEDALIKVAAAEGIRLDQDA